MGIKSFLSNNRRRYILYFLLVTFICINLGLIATASILSLGTIPAGIIAIAGTFGLSSFIITLSIPYAALLLGLLTTLISTILLGVFIPSLLSFVLFATKLVLNYILSYRLISNFIGKICETKIPFLKNIFIFFYIHIYNPKMNEAAETDPYAYESFQALFCRNLNMDLRPLCLEGLASPVDGTIKQLGTTDDGTKIKAKGFLFTIAGLLGPDLANNYANDFADGDFVTLYLSPDDYHHVHMPLNGKLLTMSHIPGKTFPVSPFAVNHITNLYARNERMVSIFDIGKGQKMAVVMVGAANVNSIKVAWKEDVLSLSDHVVTENYEDQKPPIYFARGKEMGNFRFGSTVIVLLPKNFVNHSWVKNNREHVDVRSALASLS